MTLVTTAPDPGHPTIEVVPVETAEDMAAAVWGRVEDVDAVVMAAAVADFRPEATQESKLRRADGPPSISLVPTPDILSGVVARAAGARIVGFAAETGDLGSVLEKALGKNVDLVVANDVTRPGSGFGSDTNEVRFIFRDGTTRELPLTSKAAVATAIWDAVLAIEA